MKKEINKSTIAVVLGSNIHWAPYYYRYEKILNNLNAEFDLIIWNREGIIENTKCKKVIEFKKKDVSDNKNPLKFFKFISFTKFVKNQLKKNKYKKIIFLGTHGCAPVFLANFLKAKYKNQYWLDIRDYEYEWFLPYNMLEKKSIINSYATSISSKGYESFLPKNITYYYMHNIDPNINEYKKHYLRSESINNKIRISFIGNVRYLKENEKLIDLFANDDRFVLKYHGAGSEKINEYCIKNGINNVETSGRFDPTEVIDFYNNTDIINNVYGNDKIGLTTALSNKLYYSICFKIPMLVCKNTYMNDITSKNGFGFTVEYDKSYPDKLYKEYNEYSKSGTAKFDKVWNDIMNDEKEVLNKFDKFIKG